VAALLLWVGTAHAGRKKVVVLDFEGPKAEKFHDDLVKLIGKKHTVVSTDKWNEKAEELDAGKVTEKNVKKLAKKLHVDGVVTGKIEKRRDEYIIRLKLRSGATGEILGSSVQTKAEGPRLDAQAQRDIKDELIAAIDDLDSNGGSSEDEDEDSGSSSAFKKRKGSDATDEEDDGGSHKSGFSRKGKGMDEDADEEDPKAAKKRKAEEEKKKKADEEEAKRLAKEEEEKAKKEEAQRKKDEDKKKKDDAKKKKADEEEEALATKKDKSDEEEEDEPKSKKRAKSSDEDEDGGGRKKRKASADEDEEGVEASSDEGESSDGRDLSVAGRAMDVVVGMSFTARTLKFSYAQALGKVPPGYKQSIPVAGAMIDLTAYPMSFSKGSKGIIRNIGLELLYDQVLVINSQKRYADAMGVQQIANLPTSENRWAFGPVLRYPVGALVVGGALTYGKQKFSIAQTLPPAAGMNVSTDIPSVEYTMITPKAFLKYPLGTKAVLNADLQFHAVTNTGQIQNSGTTGYGAATVTGFELEGGGDYMVTKNIFARLTLRYETISFKFKGDPTSQSNIRDNDGTTQDVMGAKDVYLGGSVTAGYVY
jgi:hypothetical protein